VTEATSGTGDVIAVLLANRVWPPNNQPHELSLSVQLGAACSLLDLSATTVFWWHPVAGS
jgi:hypothetical protein